MPRARTSDECPQHHNPPGECPPWSRHGHTIRGRDDDWQGAQQANGHKDIADWIAVAMETRLQHVRCPRCDYRDPASPPVPLICGDMTGKTVDEWIDVAEKRVRAQHPRHEPVWLGQEPSSGVAPVPDDSLLRARARAGLTTIPEVPDRKKRTSARA